ncbi:leucine-rich repeat domain-containing protein [Chryseobacterium sp. MYb264]|uniref:leucine-rich repeat domain-containing protein n=1 Tax=Chryseobacterium sp. MYb264 TaxID=2745153 RepID=UPI002E0F8A27|nr:leucine-rich repeat domain-containing protein [Chryseobacterium sp. MYb264]
MITKEELKLNFENGDRPTQKEFWEWMDSYWHKEEKISQDSLEGIEKVIPFILNDNLLGSTIELSIPKNIKKILRASYTYSGMSYQITKVNFNEGLEEIESSAFNSQNIKVIKTPSTLKVIRNSAFAYQMNGINGSDGLEEIILNKGLEIIEDYAFINSDRSSVKELYIPSSVKFVGVNAFYLPSLQSVSAPSGLDLSNAGIPATATITYR